MFERGRRSGMSRRGEQPRGDGHRTPVVESGETGEVEHAPNLQVRYPSGHRPMLVHEDRERPTNNGVGHAATCAVPCDDIAID